MIVDITSASSKSSVFAVHTNAFSNLSILESVFKKFRFGVRKHRFVVDRRPNRSCVFKFIHSGERSQKVPFSVFERIVSEWTKSQTRLKKKKQVRFKFIWISVDGT